MKTVYRRLSGCCLVLSLVLSGQALGSKNRKNRVCETATGTASVERGQGRKHERNRIADGVDYLNDILAGDPMAHWVLSPMAKAQFREMVEGMEGPSSGMPSVSGAGNVSNGAIELSVEVWMKFKRGDRQQGTVAAFYACDNAGVCGGAKAVLELQPGGFLKWSISDRDGKMYSVSTSDSLADGSWHHVVAVYDRANAIIYYDGERTAKVARALKMVAKIPDLISGAGNLGFLNSVDANVLENVNHLSLYARALSLAEIRAHAHHKACKPNTPDDDSDGDDTTTPPPPIPSYMLSVGVTGNGTVVDAAGAINCGTICSATYEAGGTVVLMATPGFDSSFQGWTGGTCSGTDTCAVTMDAAAMVTANFALVPAPSPTVMPDPDPQPEPTPAPQVFSLTVNESGNGVVSDSTGAINCGSACTGLFDDGTTVTLTATPSGTSTFAGWSGGWCSGTGDCTVTMRQSLSVTATFLESQYPLNIINGGGGMVKSNPSGIWCGSTCSAMFPTGSSVTLTAEPAPNGSFYGWSGGWCSGTGDCTVPIGQPITVYAVFQNALTISNSGGGTVLSSPSGIDCGSSCVAKFDPSVNVVLTAIPDAGNTFQSWGGGWCGGTADCTVNMDTSKTVFAKFLFPNYPVIVSIVGAGTVTSSTGMTCTTGCTQTVDTGTTVVLQATADPGYTFTGWGGGWCSGTGTCSVPVYQTTQIFATFSPN
ncbi:MAG: hypothetical protein HYR96_13905 [Deltaproteobacteria bacterium]|nr:hypothetical protein [Deltaproteobacteria bacterium]MBI3293887.1 hypothetical protein [Deltaproteobacteria bacterium]